MTKKDTIDCNGKKACNKERKVDPIGIEISRDVYEDKKENACPKRFDDIPDCLSGHLIAGFFHENDK